MKTHKGPTKNEKLEKQRRERADASERAWRITQIAASLAKQTTFCFLNEGGTPLISIHNRQAELIQLIKDATFLLYMAETDVNALDAYTLFTTDGWFTAPKIATVFRQRKWTGLTDESSVKKLFDELLNHLRQREKTDRYLDAQPRKSKDPFAPMVISPTRSPMRLDPFWEPVDGLERRKRRKGATRQLTEYRAKKILLLAHSYASEKLRAKIRRNFPTKI